MDWLQFLTMNDRQLPLGAFCTYLSSIWGKCTFRLCRGPKLWRSTCGRFMMSHEGSGDPGGGCVLPQKKWKLYAIKVRFGAYVCVVLLFQHERIVDSILPGDLVQAPGAGRLTFCFWETPGNFGRLGTQICQAISSHLRHVSTIGKKHVKQQYLHMSSQCGERRPTNRWDRLVSLRHSSTFQRVSRFGFVTAPTSLNGGQPNFERCLAVSWATFWGSCPATEFCQCQVQNHFASKSCILLYIGSVTARHSSSGRQPNFAAWYLWYLHGHGGHPVRHWAVELSSFSCDSL